MNDQPDEKTKEAAIAAQQQAEALEAKASKPTGRGAKGRVLVTCTVGGGRRRGGYGFSSTPTEIPLNKLTSEVLAAIEADPQLSVKFAD